jgi:AcrR family transcriptional regulator
MARAGLARTVFYRHFDDLAQLASDLLPDAGDPIIDRVRRVSGGTREIVAEMVGGLVTTFADHGPLLQAIDDAARSDPAVAARLEVALVGPRALIAELLAAAPAAPPDPAESARLLMAAHRAYLLDRFGGGGATPASRAAAVTALEAMWARLLAERHAPDWGR